MSSGLVTLVEIGLTIFAAALCGMLAKRAHLPSVIGYLAAGMALGPFTPGYVVRSSTVADLAEVGVALLLFGFGISFAARGIASISRVAVFVNASLVALLAAFLWFLAGTMGSANPLAVATTGGLAALALSAAILRQTFHARGGNVLLLQAFLVVQHSSAIAFLAAIVLPTASTVSEAGGVAIRTTIFVVGSVLVAIRILPWLARLLSGTRVPHWCEIAGLAFVAVPFAFAAVASHLPVGVGTFAAGLALARCANTASLARTILRFRAIVAVMIFVALGTVLNPLLFVDHWLVITILIVCIAVAVTLALRSGLPRSASPLMMLVLLAPLMDIIPITDFHAMFGNIAIHASSLSESDQLSIVTLVFIALGGTIVSGILTRDSRQTPANVLVLSVPPFSERR